MSNHTTTETRTGSTGFFRFTTTTTQFTGCPEAHTFTTAEFAPFGGTSGFQEFARAAGNPWA